MNTCKQCGQVVQELETFCPRCGSGQIIADSSVPVKKQVKATPKKNQGEQPIEQPIKEKNAKQLKCKQAKTNSKLSSDANTQEDNRAGYIDDEVVTIKEYLIFCICLYVPFYGLYKIIKVAIGGPKIKRSMTNIIRANLILALIGVVVAIIFSATLGEILISIINSLN